MTLSSGRLAAILIFIFALAFAWQGAQIEYAFSSDPLGPKAFPLLLAGILAALSVWLFCRPGHDTHWPLGKTLWKALGIPLAVVTTALLLNPLGFFAAVFLMVAMVGWIFGASPRLALLGAGLQAAVWQVVFVYLLGVYLPTGTLWQGIFS
jgi:putative tricarboxylic transport membrane protein